MVWALSLWSSMKLIIWGLCAHFGIPCQASEAMWSNKRKVREWTQLKMEAPCQRLSHGQTGSSSFTRHLHPYHLRLKLKGRVWLLQPFVLISILCLLESVSWGTWFFDAAAVAPLGNLSCNWSEWRPIPTSPACSAWMETSPWILIKPATFTCLH